MKLACLRYKNLCFGRERCRFSSGIEIGFEEAPVACPAETVIEGSILRSQICELGRRTFVKRVTRVQKHDMDVTSDSFRRRPCMLFHVRYMASPTFQQRLMFTYPEQRSRRSCFSIGLGGTFV